MTELFLGQKVASCTPQNTVRAITPELMAGSARNFNFKNLKY
jgi:hypothetical protein